MKLVDTQDLGFCAAKHVGSNSAIWTTKRREKQMKKVIENGHVAVVHSCDWGQAWYSWHGVEELLFLPELVEIVSSKRETLDEEIAKVLKSYDLDYGWIPDLTITWVPVGLQFTITEYDGYETVMLQREVKWLVA